MVLYFYMGKEINFCVILKLKLNLNFQYTDVDREIRGCFVFMVDDYVMMVNWEIQRQTH